MAKVFVVYGAPCSGKTTYVREHASPEDLVIDVDCIEQAISVNRLYADNPKPVVATALYIRDTLLSLVQSGTCTNPRVWIIGGYPRRATRVKLYKELKAEPVFIDTDIETCLERAKDKRKGYQDIVKQWFERYEEDSYLMDLYADKESKKFYDSSAWRKKRAQVLAMDHYECQMCKEEGRHTRATVVHHVKHLKDRPDLRLEIFDNGERQLISLCESCHDKVHPEKLKKKSAEEKPLTEEFW